MRLATSVALTSAGILLTLTASAQTLRDVPNGHWARPAVLEVVRQNIMEAPGGRFNGTRAVTRRELIVALERMAKSLEAGKWPKTGAPRINEKIKAKSWRDRPVTRYELAAVIHRLALYSTQGLPKATGKVYNASEAIPPPVALTGVARSDPSFASLEFLVKNRMIWPGSPLLKPGPQPVTGAQASLALSQMISGLNARLTDEPQNREEIGPPPRRHNTPPR
jgi:hypothetical protein